VDRYSSDVTSRPGAPVGAADGSVPKPSFASRLFGYDVFLSFALGPQPRGTRSYARDLARRLRERDVSVFFSEDEVPPGQPLDSTLRKALLRSKTLVVVANRGTLRDPGWVRKEVEEFRSRHPGRPLIPINVGHALQDKSLAESAQEWLGYDGKIWLDETEEAVAKAIASDEVVRRLAMAPMQVKANARWRWVVSCVVLALAALAIGIGAFAKIARERGQIAFSRQLAAQSAAQLARDRQASLLLALQAYRAAHTDQADEALRRAALAYPHRIAMGGGTGPLWDVAFSPDGQRAVTASKDGAVRCWAADTGELLADLSNVRGAVLKLSFSPDGALILGRGNGFVRIWDARTLEPIESDLTRISDVLRARFSTRGKFIVTGLTDGTATVWDTHTGRRIVELRTHLEPLAVAGPAFSPDEGSIVTADADGVARIWNVPSGELAAELKGHKHRLSSVEFSPDGNHVLTAASLFALNAKIEAEENGVRVFGGVIGASERDNTVRIWDLNTGKMVSINGTFQNGYAAFAPGGNVVAVNTWGGMTFLNLAAESRGFFNGRLASFSRDGSLFATVEGNETVRIRRMTDYQVVAVYPGEFGLFSQDRRRFLTAGPDGSVFIWNLDQDLGAAGLRQPPKEFLSVSFSHSGAMIATTDKDGMAQLWDGTSGTEVTPVTAPDLSGQRIREATLAKDDLLLTLDRDGQAVVRNLTSGRISRLDSPFPIEHAEFSPDGSRVLTRSQSGSGPSVCNLQLWNADTGNRIAGICLVGERRPYARFGSDGAWIETYTASGALLWDGHDGRRIAEFPVGESYIRSSNSHWVATFAEGNSISIWNARTGRKIHALRVYARSDMISTDVHAMFSPDSSLVVTLGEPIRIWDPATGKKVREFAGGSGVVFSPDGRLVATNQIREARSGEILAELEDPLGGPTAFSKDGKWLVGSTDYTVSLWDVKTGKILTRFISTGKVLSAHLAPGARWLVLTLSSDSGSRVQIYPWERFAPFDELLGFASTLTLRTRADVDSTQVE